MSKHHEEHPEYGAMGMDWAPVDPLSQAIPPAYAECIGRAAMKIIRPELREAAE